MRLSAARGGIKVPADQDRFGQRRKVFGSLPIDLKFSGTDTTGNLLLVEQIDDKRGGPPQMGDSIGRLLIGCQPAGEMEEFFAASTKLDEIPAGPELARLFAEHGMELLGPPLPTG